MYTHMSEQKNEPSVRMERISKSFGGLKAVQDVDLELYAGEIVGLMGDNGAGKTTLMKILSGVHKPDSGSIYINGQKVSFDHRLIARRMGIEMVYQDLGLCDVIDIAENMFMGRELVTSYLGLKILDKKRMRSEATRCLKELGIDFPPVKTKVRNLSGGQRKAIAVERAVYWNTKIVLMDEPTAALGVKEQKKVLEITKGLKERKVGVIFISHNLEEIFSTVDRIVVLSRGRKVADVKRENIGRDEIIQLMIS